jgi:hypothetical protein
MIGTLRKRFQTITTHFAGFQAECLNVHVDFPRLQRLALPPPSVRSPIPESKSTTRGSPPEVYRGNRIVI